VKDKRSKRIALVAHCILNQNAKVSGLARFPAADKHLVDLFLKLQFGVFQLPCPEMNCAGLRRWWMVREQYEAPPFLRRYTEMATRVVNEIEEYLLDRYLVVLVGIDGSPSCGIALTESDPSWGGPPSVEFKNQVEYLVSGPGAFVALLQSEIERRGFARLPQIGVPLDIHEGLIDYRSIEAFLTQLEHVLPDVPSGLC